MRHTIISILFLCVTALLTQLHAQRRINPVETPASQTKAVNLNPKDTTATPDPSKMPNLIHYHDDKGNVVWVDTITGKEFIDSTKIKKKTEFSYPLWDEVTIGLNVWDPAMRCFGQDYGLADMWVELSLYNRFKPVIEFGLGQASHTPEDGNYTYKSGVAPYFKIGANYNFLYSKTKEYQFYAGLRYGFTPFSFEVTDITIDNSYWNENFATSIASQNVTAGYGEIVMGLKVQIHKNWSLGWAFKYHTILHESKCDYGEPWYIPGFGSRGSSLSGAFNVMYTIPLGKKKSVPQNDADATDSSTHTDSHDSHAH